MSNSTPGVADFIGEPGTPTCPKCGAIMDRGGLQAEHDLTYTASHSPGWTDAIPAEARACIACGYIELYTDPVVLRRMLAGVEPPRQSKKPGLL